MAAPITPGAAQAIAHHNHEADKAHVKAVAALGRYNVAIKSLQEAVAASDAQRAARAEAEADRAWYEMNELLALGYQHRNSAVIAAGLAVEINDGRAE